jgi:hypothetical protein
MCGGEVDLAGRVGSAEGTGLDGGLAMVLAGALRCVGDELVWREGRLRNSNEVELSVELDAAWKARFHRTLSERKESESVYGKSYRRNRRCLDRWSRRWQR